MHMFKNWTKSSVITIRPPLNINPKYNRINIKNRDFLNTNGVFHHKTTFYEFSQSTDDPIIEWKGYIGTIYVNQN